MTKHTLVRHTFFYSAAGLSKSQSGEAPVTLIRNFCFLILSTVTSSSNVYKERLSCLGYVDALRQIKYKKC